MIQIYKRDSQIWGTEDIKHLEKYGWIEYGYENQYESKQDFLKDLELIENKLVDNSYRQPLSDNKMFYDIKCDETLVGRLTIIKNYVRVFELSIVIYDQYSKKGYARQAIDLFIKSFSPYEYLKVEVVVTPNNPNRNSVISIFESLDFNKVSDELYVYENQITDLEYRLLSQLSYKDMTLNYERLYPKFVNDINHSIPLLELTDVIKDFRAELTNNQMTVLNKNNPLKGSLFLEKILDSWKLVISLQGLLANEEGKTLLKKQGFQNVYLDAYVFSKKYSNKLVVVYKGSNFSFSKQGFWDIIENTKAGSGDFFKGKNKYNTLKQVFTQVDNAIGFYLLIKRYFYGTDISLSGHSKGGVLVQKVIQYMKERAEVDVRGVTFSSPATLGVKYTSNKKEVRNFSDYTCVNYISKGDKVIWGSKGLNLVTSRTLLKAYVGKAILVESSVKDFWGHGLFHYDSVINYKTGMIRSRLNTKR